MRVIVCGGRHYSDWTVVAKTLDAIHAKTPFSIVINGLARGADRLAARWAAERGIELQFFDPEWERYGKSGGPRRNSRMLIEGRANLVISFPGGDGTADMVRKAYARGVRVIEVTA